MAAGPTEEDVRRETRELFKGCAAAVVVFAAMVTALVLVARGCV